MAMTLLSTISCGNRWYKFHSYCYLKFVSKMFSLRFDSCVKKTVGFQKISLPIFTEDIKFRLSHSMFRHEEFLSKVRESTESKKISRDFFLPLLVAMFYTINTNIDQWAMVWRLLSKYIAACTALILFQYDYMRPWIEYF